MAKGAPSKGPNQKVEAGRALQAANAAKQQAAAEQQRAQQDAADWAVGSNAKRASREQELAAKADDAARKRQEKAELLAAEEAALGTGGTTTTAKKAELTVKKKKANQKRNDLALLEDALVSAADKKAKKKKAAEQLAQQQREQQERASHAKKQTEQQAMDPLLANTEQMIGAVLDDNDNEGFHGGRRANQARMEETAASGLEAGLESLNVSVGPKLVSAKALYSAFEERMLPQVKADHPGLRLSQYKEKVWALWKKAPENPANQLPADSASP